jgi:hypothetical protein
MGQSRNTVLVNADHNETLEVCNFPSAAVFASALAVQDKTSEGHGDKVACGPRGGCSLGASLVNVPSSFIK